jgi:hypothetical protein
MKGEQVPANPSRTRRRVLALACATTLLGAVASAAVAAPASASHDGCGMHVNIQFDGSAVVAQNFYQCPGSPPLNFAVGIDKKVGDSWVRVAQGQGVATYRCRGNTMSTYRRWSTQLPRQEITARCA